MKRIIHLLSFLFLWTSVACSEFAEEAQPYQSGVTEQSDKTLKTRAGVVYEKMANPYSLENMQAVYDSLYVPTPG